MKNLVALFAAGTIVAALGCRDAESPILSEPSQSLSGASAPLSFAQVSMGGAHACGVTTENKAYCWGANNGGMLGIGIIKPVDNYSATPVAVVGGLSFRAISAGSTHSCGLTTDDRAYCWGDNYAAQLGDGTRNYRTRPTAVSGGHRFRQLRAGHIHTCAVTFTDLVFCWGDNSRGQLGDGTTHGLRVPVQVSGGVKFRQVLAGGSHTCAMTQANRAYCWGDNAYGQLGDGTFTQRLAPVPVKGGLLFPRLSAGAFHSCGVTVAGRAYCWGRNQYGALGIGERGRWFKPVAVAGQLVFVNGINAGNEYTCGVTSGNVAYCWGNGNAGRLGNGTTADRLTPTRVSGGIHFVGLTTSVLGRSTCGRTTDLRGYCWGNNFHGELGDGSITDRLTPVPVMGPM